MELPRREFLHLAAGRSSARRFSHSNPLLVLALLVLEERKHGEIFQRNYTTVARALDERESASVTWRASADLLDHRLPQSLLGQCTGPRREGVVAQDVVQPISERRRNYPREARRGSAPP